MTLFSFMRKRQAKPVLARNDEGRIADFGADGPDGMPSVRPFGNCELRIEKKRLKIEDCRLMIDRHSLFLLATRDAATAKIVPRAPCGVLALRSSSPKTSRLRVCSGMLKLSGLRLLF